MNKGIKLLKNPASKKSLGKSLDGKVFILNKEGVKFFNKMKLDTSLGYKENLKN